MSVFPMQGAYKVQNFIFRTSTAHSSMTNSSEMNLLERSNGSLKVLQNHQSSVIYSFIFVHSAMSEIHKNVHSLWLSHEKRQVGHA